MTKTGIYKDIEKRKEYLREQNKKNAKKEYKCECGAVIKNSSKKYHIKSEKHILKMKLLQIESLNI